MSYANDFLYLMHYGTPRHSGRYPWGSGEDPYQHEKDFISRIEDAKKEGFEETPESIRKFFNITTTDYRKQKRWAIHQRRMDCIKYATTLRDKYKLGPTDIGKEMGVSESTVRGWLKDDAEAKTKVALNLANSIEDDISKKGMIDIGKGVERELNVSREMLDEAIFILEERGYKKLYGSVEQVTNPGKTTHLMVIAPKDAQKKDVYDTGNIHSINDYCSTDGGSTIKKLQYPASISSDRVAIRYSEDGGDKKDGSIEIRPGVKDLSLGDSHYAQVRILVDGTHYIKGMAYYSDKIPKGKDIIFNTCKTKDVPALGPKDNTVLKTIKTEDPNDPFGCLIKANGQSSYIGDDGKEHLSAINKKSEEGDWSEWKDALPAQFLSKQSKKLAERQLRIALEDKETEYEMISDLTNPTVKKHLLTKFADECDASAVALKAAALPSQKYHVIMPITTLSDKECYAPQYEDGTKLALIRYPHGGTFEIPIVTVNNKNKQGIEMFGPHSNDVIGINSKVASRLSGADYDGDTVMAIPTGGRTGIDIASTPQLEDLEGFDPNTAYPYHEGMQVMQEAFKQKQMGIISNLITDMTLFGASPSELARAVKHSMVVIDAPKHRLDYKRSETENGIKELIHKYQTRVNPDGSIHYGGASSLISRSKGETRVPKKRGQGMINQKGKPWYDPNRPEGVLIYKPAEPPTYITRSVNKKTGEIKETEHQKLQISTNMAETDDARTLISDRDTPMERLYSSFANHMKSMANKARLEYANTGRLAYSKEAHVKYKPEVESILKKLNYAELNYPRERMAQMKASAEIKSIPGFKDLKKKRQRAIAQKTIEKYRNELGTIERKQRNISITDKEWEAIQAGAISENVLNQILKNTDIDRLRELSTPSNRKPLSDLKIQRIKSLSNSGYTLYQIGKMIGVSASTVSKYLKGSD